MESFHTSGFDVGDGNSSTQHGPTIVSLLPVANAGVHRSFSVTAGQTIVIGRSSRDVAKGLLAATDNTLFDCPVVSRRHAELVSSAGHVAIVDTGSSHGTFVNGVQLARGDNHPLVPGDRVTLGCEINSTHGNHDGVTFIVEDIDRPAAFCPGPSKEPARRGFCMYGEEDSEHDSASDKDDASIVEEQHSISSNQTTPDSKVVLKCNPGSLGQPIDVDRQDGALHDLIKVADDVDEEIVEKTFSMDDNGEDMSTVWDAPPDDDDDEDDSYDDESIDEEQDAVVSIVLDSESDSDEHEYDDDESSIHDHPPFELDPPNIISEPESIDEGPELMSSKKQVSPELGDPGRNFTQHSVLRYDPVRGSQPPCPANASSPEIMPPYFSYAPPSSTPRVAPCTDIGHDRRWDIPPPPLEQYQGGWTHSCVAPEISPIYPQYLEMAPIGNLADTHSFAQSLSSGHDKSDFSIPAAPTKLSIQAVLDNSPTYQPGQEQTGHVAPQFYPVSPSFEYPPSRKRKNEEISQDETELHVSVEATNTSATPAAVGETADSEALQHFLTLIQNEKLKEPPAKKMKTAASVATWSLKEATRMICYAAVGAAASFAFLVSPAAETLHNAL